MPYTETRDGTTLFYQDWGQGRPIVFVSSWALSSAMWQYQMLELSERGLRCVAYDRRGHGRSDQPGGGYDIDTLADDLAAVMEHLDLREATLVGHSMGGGEIVRCLARHGADRVARVAFVDCTLPCAMRTDDNPEGWVEESAAQAILDASHRDLPRWMVENIPPFIGEGLPGCSVSDAIVEWTRQDYLRASLKALVGCFRANITADFRSELQGLTLPTLIVHADHSASAPLEHSGRRVAELVPHARLEVYENAAHALYMTHRDRLTTDLLHFVEQAAAAAA